MDTWYNRNIFNRNCKLCGPYSWFWLVTPRYVYTKTIIFKVGKRCNENMCKSSAFFESYVTHLMSNTFQKDSHDIGLPVPVSIIILAGSFFLILWYFVLYPMQLHKKGVVLEEGKIIKNGITYE